MVIIALKYMLKQFEFKVNTIESIKTENRFKTVTASN